MKLNFFSALNTVLSRIPATAANGAKLFLIIALIGLSSCKKESEIGAGILPEDDMIGLDYTDSFPLLAYTVREDSLRSDESPIVQVGSLNEPLFGITNASLYTQVSIPNNQLNLNFGTSPVIDSAQLWLAYDFDYYGDTTSTQTFHVYQMVEDIHRDSLYYSNQSKSVYQTSIGTLSFTPAPRSNSVVGTDTIPAVIRIPIDNNFAQLILNESNGPNLASNSAFQSFMKGFYVVPDQAPAGSGAILHFDLLDTLSGFKLYYHTTTDTAEFDFEINSGTAYFSHFDHDYSGAGGDIQNQLQNPGQAATSEVYIQSCAGLKTRIEFPALDSLRNLSTPIAINKAELVIKADPTQATANFPVNKQLFVVSIDSTGKQYIVPDFLENSVYFGGTLNTTTNEYRINLARYVQDLLTGGGTHEAIYLKEIYGVEEGRRAVIGAPGSSQYRMYLHLVYTRIN